MKDLLNFEERNPYTFLWAIFWIGLFTDMCVHEFAGIFK